MNRSLFCYALAAVLLIQTTVTAHEGDKQPATTIGNNSLQLIANKGQLTDQDGQLRRDIDAKAEHNGVTMFVGNGQLHYQWIRSESQKSCEGIPLGKVKSPTSGAKGVSSLTPEEGRSEVSIYRMDVTLVGANKNAEVVFEAPTGYYENYYLAYTGNDGVKANGYSKMTYKNVYPNIDWVFYTSPDEQKGLKYDFIIHPGGNPADIRLRYDGATELKLEKGALVAITPYGSITEDAPYSYLQDSRKQVASAYKLDGNELRFNVQPSEHTLVIDPTLKWCTYYGGTNDHLGLITGASDTAGNAYIYSETNQASNIATTGSHQQSLAGASDIYLVKFNIAGVRQWATYYGGSKDESLIYNGHTEGVCTDETGNVYIVGATSSDTGISTLSSYQPNIKIGSNSIDGFIAKFNTNGQRQWGTYYGDTLADGLMGIKVDHAGNLCVYGYAHQTSKKFGTRPSYLPAVTSGYVGHIAKFTPAGQYLFGTYTQDMRSLQIDKYGYIYTAGKVPPIESVNITTPGTHSQSKNGTSEDVFLMKNDAMGQRIWCTYYGGANGDVLSSMACTDSNYIYISGLTNSTTGIATTGAYKTKKAVPSTGTQYDAFLARFNAVGKLVWATYLGTDSLTAAASVVVTPRQDAIICGSSFDINNVATPRGFQRDKKAVSSTTDGIIVQFDSVGRRIWGTYLGGPNLSGMNALTASGEGDHISTGSLVYNKGIMHLFGRCFAKTGMVTPGAHMTTFPTGFGIADFVAQITVNDTVLLIEHSFTDTFFCAGDSISIPYYVNYNFRSGNIFKVQLSNASGSFASPVTLANITGTTSGIAKTVIPANTPAGAGYRLRVTASNPVDTSADNGFDITVRNNPAAFSAAVNKDTLCTADTLRLSSSTSTSGVTFAWMGPNSFTANTATATIPNPSLAASGKYYITVENKGCIVRDTFSVLVRQTPQNVTAGNNAPVCSGDTLKLTSSSTTPGVTYSWAPGNYSTQNVFIPNVAISQGGTYTVSVTLAGCTAMAVSTIAIDQGATVNIVPLTGVVICVGENASFTGFTAFAGTNPQLQWQVNGADIPGATNAGFNINTLNNNDKVRLRVTPNTACTGIRYSNEILMKVVPPKKPSVSITVDKAPPWHDNTDVTFTATAANATSVNGLPPTYQWKKNGQDIGGAISNYWAVNTNALNDNDKICVLVTSAYECPVPDTVLSNCINTQFTGISSQVLADEIRVYPNPVNNILRVEAPLRLSPKGRGLTVELYDIVGRKCDVEYRNDEIDMSALPAGNYVLQVTGGNGERAYFKVTKE